MELEDERLQWRTWGSWPIRTQNPKEMERTLGELLKLDGNGDEENGEEREGERMQVYLFGWK